MVTGRRSSLLAAIAVVYLKTCCALSSNTAAATTTTTTNSCSSPLISTEDIQKISQGGVAIIPNWLPPHLITAMHDDAQQLFQDGQFRPDGLTNTAIKEQGFSKKADRQTFRGGAGWDSDIGDLKTRQEFADRMKELRIQLAQSLNRPTLAEDGTLKHEMTYNWYEPGAKLGRHLDEHHEETKGPTGWMTPTRRSVTWLVYLNEGWTKEEGGALRCLPRSDASIQKNTVQVGCHEGNLQVGWINDGVDPVFLDVFRESGGAALYQVNNNNAEREILSVRDFDVPAQPIDFSKFLKEDIRESFAQISTSRLDPRFANKDAAANNNNGAIAQHDFECSDEPTILDVTPVAGTLVVFDSVSLPHLVREVTGKRQRIAATGWFHEDSQFSIEM
ncbi:2OG-Fe(II) oxygenase family protein [Skeletonema marinoi]|uniref:2OG-Fe(II) oxygenase family protein n=1 Tax=Skeletonema marinoi TaxID=267567 RepID=A0AAD8Y5K6_9STRA|nr:2OG-Fe(II) oxygenase family protein [Skeletonema marinoi]